MEIKHIFLQDNLGNVVRSPIVSVYSSDNPNELLEHVYDAAGSIKENPFVGSERGQISLALPDGTYIFSVRSGNKNKIATVVFKEKASAAAIGISGSDATLPPFTGDVIPDDSTVRSALQALETDSESRAKTTDLASTDIGKGAALSGYKRQGLTAAQARTLATKSDDRFDYRDMLGADLTGGNDNASVMQAAVNESAATGAPLHMPKGRPTLGSTIDVPRGAVIDGYLKDAQHDQDYSAVYVNHAGVGFNFQTAGGARAMRNMTIWRNQPASAPGWTPNDNGFDIQVIGAQDIEFDNIHFANGTRGIKITGNTGAGIPSGRINIGSMTGRPALVGMEAEHVLDCIYADEVHFWPFINDANFNAYMLANGEAFRLGKVDNAKFGRLFGFGYRHNLRIIQTPAAGSLTGGSVSKLYVGVYGADYCRTGLYVDEASTLATARLDYFYATGDFGDLSDTPLIINRGTASIIDIGRLDAEGGKGTAIETNGLNAQTIIGSLLTNRWDNDASGDPAIVSANNSRTIIGQLIEDFTYPQPANLIGASQTVSIDKKTVGQATITAGQTFVDVTHNMPFIPATEMINLQLLTGPAGSTFSGFTNVTATSFRINVTPAPSQNIVYGWSVDGRKF